MLLKSEWQREEQILGKEYIELGYSQRFHRLFLCCAILDFILLLPVVGFILRVGGREQ